MSLNHVMMIDSCRCMAHAARDKKLAGMLDEPVGESMASRTQLSSFDVDRGSFAREGAQKSGATRPTKTGMLGQG